MLNVRVIGKIQVACRGILTGSRSPAEIDMLLKLRFGTFQELLEQSGLITIGGDLHSSTTYQDLINTLLLFFAVPGGHSLVATSFRPPGTHREKPKNRP